MPSKVSNKYVETSLKLMVIKFLEYDSICQGESDLIRTVRSMKFLSARAGAAQYSTVFMQI